MWTFSTRSGPYNRRCERFSAGTPPPTIGFRTSAHSPAQFSFSVLCSIHTFISPPARCFRLRAHYSPSPRACSARDHGNSCGASLCRWRSVGVSLALLETLNDIGASEYLGVHTLTLSIFTTWLNRGSLAGAAQMACLMLLIVIA